MLLFYTPDLHADYITLSADESRHCIRVLRMTTGDTLYLTDGQGTLCRCEIALPDASACSVAVVERTEHYGARPYRLHLAVSPTKNAARIEWLVEKAVEIGVDEITLLHCEHSEHSNLKADRLSKIAVSAMKQSLRAYLPAIHNGVSFTDFISQHSGHDGLYICHCDGDQRQQLSDIYNATHNATILIGPEGDFSPKEIASALAAGFKPVTLGNQRLRTETAALYATIAINILNTI